MHDRLNELEVQYKMNQTLAGNIARMEELLRLNRRDSYINSTGMRLLEDMKQRYREGCAAEQRMAQTMVNRYAVKQEVSA